MPTALPRHCRSGHCYPVRSNHSTSQPILHIRPQRRTRHQLRRLWTPRRPLGMPLRCCGPILQLPTARRSITPQLARDRRGCTAQPVSNLPHPKALDPPQRDLLAVQERQIPPRERRRRSSKRRWWHAARLPKPAKPDWWRHSYTARCVFARLTCRNQRPEAPPVFTPCHPWPAWRMGLRPQCPIRTPSSCHRATLHPGVATTT